MIEIFVFSVIEKDHSMGLYYIYCTRCNADGSYTRSRLNPDCGQCSGTGNDYIDDNPEEREHLLRKGRGQGRNGEDLEIRYDPNVDSSSSRASNYTEVQEEKSSNWLGWVIFIGVLFYLFKD